MTRAQSTVIWLGLVLIALNLVIHISEFKSVLFGSSSGPTQGNPVQPSQGQHNTPPGIHVQVPNPLIPGIGILLPATLIDRQY